MNHAMSNQNTFDLLRDFIPGIVVIAVIVIWYRLGISSRWRSAVQQWAASKRFDFCSFSGAFSRRFSLVERHRTSR